MNDFSLSSNNDIESLKHRPVRDLAWALFHPRLFNTLPSLPESYLSQSWIDDDVIPWLTHLDRSPERLLEHLKGQRATRLGIYFEQLLSFYFSHYPRFKLIQKNLQVNNSQRTIGEYDFIIFDHKDRRYYHIEVAVKFYLGYLTSEQPIKNNHVIHNWHEWLGPNKKDSLGIKMQHLINHQLSLSKTEEGKQTLNEIGINEEIINVKLLLTGRLYYPANTTNNGRRTSHKPQAPQYSHYPTEPTAFWFSDKEFIKQHHSFINPQDYYTILPRQLWMSELIDEDIATFSLELISGKAIVQRVLDTLANHSDHLHIAQLIDYPLDNDTKSLKENTLREVQRFFITTHST